MLPDDTFRDKFRTGSGPLNGAVLYVLSMPANLWFVAEVADALTAMTKTENWQKVGTLEIIDAVSAASEVLMSFQSLVGAILPVVWDSIPDNFLLCDGTQYLRVDYPALYAVLPSAFIVDADHFTVPNLVGRTVIGVSASHPIGQTGGAESHTLSSSEMPAHTHSEGTTTPSATVVGEIPAIGITGVVGVTGSAGGGAAHNNMQPFQALKYVIAAR